VWRAGWKTTNVRTYAKKKNTVLSINISNPEDRKLLNKKKIIILFWISEWGIEGGGPRSRRWRRKTKNNLKREEISIWLKKRKCSFMEGNQVVVA
jgi:hypothetical protein